MQASSPTRYRWAILAAASLILFFSGGVRFAFGVMLKPMQEDLLWSRSSLSLALTLNMFISALSQPFIGRMCDRYSLRLVLVGAIVLISTGIGLLGWATAKWQIFFLFGVVAALGTGGISPSPVTVLVSRWFRNGRGRANSVAISGASAGQVVVISVLASFLLALGWRSAYKILGLSILALVLPVALFVVRSWPSSPRSDLMAQQTTIVEGKPRRWPEETLDFAAPSFLGPAIGSRNFCCS